MTSGGGALAGYLTEVRAGLVGPRGRRERIVAELRDGLEATAAGYLADGLPPDGAVAAAIDEFGEPCRVADAFQHELTLAYVRRTVTLFVLTGPAVGLWWFLLVVARSWPPSPLTVVAGIPVVPLLALAIATVAATVATTGRLVRWLPEAGPGHALMATMVVAVLALSSDVVMLVLYARTVLPVGPVGPIAVAASLGRVAVSAGVVGRVLVMRRRVVRAR